MMSREKLTIEYARKIKAGEKVFEPHHYDGDDFGTYCPDDNAVLEWQYEAGIDPDSYEVYRCPKCGKEWTSWMLFAVVDAFKVAAGEDPYKNTIFVGGDKFDPDYYTKKFPFEKVDEDDEV
jgi:hypothetical protein